MSAELDPTLDPVLDLALQSFESRALDEAELFVEDTRVDSVSVSGGVVESAESDRSRGAGIRVLRDGRIGFSYTSDLSAAGIDLAVERAAAASHHAEPDDSHRFPDLDHPQDVTGNSDERVSSMSADEKISLARRVEEAARGADARVRATREAAYRDVDSRVLLGRAGGHRYGYRYTRTFAYTDLVAEGGGESQSGSFVDFAIGPDGLDPEAIGREAAHRAIRKLGGKPCATGRPPLLLSPEVVDGLLEELCVIFYGENAHKGKSILAGRIGEQVASTKVRLSDDGRLPGGCNTEPIDAEGVATRETVLLEDGVLRGFLHDAFSARRFGISSTGNSGRDSYSSAPETSASALCLRPTGESTTDLFTSVNEGLLIEEVMGLHTINPISGDFSLGATGRAVRGGQPEEAVAGIAIAGNVRDLLGAIAAVGDDLKLMSGGNRTSTILLEGLSVSGEGRSGS
jgi:PmbA protein